MNDLTVIRVPRADPNLPPLVLDMSEIYVALGRKEEVAVVNSHKAPELLSTFNIAFLNCSRLINALEYELGVAEQRIREIKAVILIDRMKDLLEEAGLSNPRNPLGSEDIRQAMYERDPEYKRAFQLADNIKCYIKNLVDMRKFFQNSYDSVKKIMGTDMQSAHARQNPYLAVSLSSGGNNQPPATTNNQAQALADDDDFFGTAR